MSHLEEKNGRSAISLCWSHEELVQASRLALLQHHYQSEKTSTSFEPNKNLFWSDNEGDISCSEHHRRRESDSEIQIQSPSSREFIHSSFIPKNLTVQTKQEKNDLLHDKTLTNVQILDNDIMCLGSIAAHTALIAARGEEEDDDYVQKKKRRRSDKETLSCCASFTQKEVVQSSILPAQELIPKNILSRAEVSQPFINTTERTRATTAAADIAAAATTTASGTTITYSNHVMEEWDRMLDKRPSTSDVVGLTQWLLKLYALATPSSEAAIIASAQGA